VAEIARPTASGIDCDMSEKEPPKKPAAQRGQNRLTKLREMVREDIEEQREIIWKLRQKLN
jgi:signal transduction histidine kinase